MSDDSFDDQKHLSLDARRRRFDPQSRHGGYGGVSTVRARPLSWTRDTNLGLADMHVKINRPRDAEGNVVVTKVDQEVPDLLAMKAEEMDGDVTGGAGGGMFWLPELLENECIGKSTQRDRTCPDVIVTTYSVKGVGWMAPGEEEKSQLEQKRIAKLTLASRESKKGLHVFCRLSDTPLDKITHPSLLDCNAKLSAPSAQLTATLGCDPRNARVFAEDCRSCWCSEVGYSINAKGYSEVDSGTERDALEIDLGVTCSVMFISTQGRFPPISHTDKGTGMRVIHEGSPYFMNWVEKYELSYRANSGRAWITLGEFKGNRDMTTEVAHDVSQLVSGGLECRYLRFRPLTYHGRPAMRVGVYGQRPGPGKESPSQKGAVRGEGGGIVQYSISHVKKDANLRRAPVGRGSCRLGCACCSKYRGICSVSGPILGVRRKQFKEGCAEEARQVSAEMQETLKPWIEEGDDAGSDQEAENIEAPSSTLPEASAISRGLPRTWSQSGTDLSRTPSSALSDSIVVVEDSEALTHFGIDDWHAV